MKEKRINEFVMELIRDKAGLTESLSDLFVKIGAVIMADTNATEFKQTAVGTAPGFNHGIQCKFVAKRLYPDKKQ